MATSIAMDRFEHFYRVPVGLGAATERFLLDTGIGITVISTELAGRPGVEHTGATYAGRRMSGRLVEVPLARIAELRIGDLVMHDHVAGVLDIGGGAEFAGILTPAIVDDRLLTIDPAQSIVTIGAPGGALPVGSVVDLHERRDGPAVDWSVELVLPSGRTVRVEVDTGSGSLILDTAYLADVGLHIDDPSLEVSTGTDETGHEWTRRWARIEGSVHLADAPETAQTAPRVMFQDIVLDGLVGTAYLDRFVTTYDFAGRRLVLSPPR